MKSKKKLAPVIAVINMKGGVGKTTISAHVFRMMFKNLRASTLVLDLDPQFNLTQALFKRKHYENIKEAGGTILAAMEPPPAAGMFEVRTSSSPPPRASEIGQVLWYFAQTDTLPREDLMVVPGDFRLVKYSLMDDNRKLTAVQKRFLRFIRQGREDFKIVCIDCNPSSSFLTLCALKACTHILVPVRPDRYSVLGLELLTDFVDSIPTISPKPKLLIVLNGVPRRNYRRGVENELRSHPVFGALTLASCIYQSNILVASPDYTGFATDKPVPYRKLLSNEISHVVSELTQHLGLS
jgi:chromosome partitioning protein